MSLGVVEPLISHLDSMTDSIVLREDRRKSGITDGLVRFSVGIKDVKDILDDFD